MLIQYFTYSNSIVLIKPSVIDSLFAENLLFLKISYECSFA